MKCFGFMPWIRAVNILRWDRYEEPRCCGVVFASFTRAYVRYWLGVFGDKGENGRTRKGDGMVVNGRLRQVRVRYGEGCLGGRTVESG